MNGGSGFLVAHGGYVSPTVDGDLYFQLFVDRRPELLVGGWHLRLLVGDRLS